MHESKQRSCQWLLLCTLTFGVAAQTFGQAAATPPSAPAPPSAAPLSAREQKDAQIKADTERLYQLARELKVEMDKSTKDTLSLSVIRKADEVEKLARSLKERLRTP